MRPDRRIRLLLCAAALSIIEALAGAQSAAAADANVRVQARPFSQLAVRVPRSAAAEVRSLNEARVAAEVAASIRDIAVRPGETVERGAVVVRLDPRDFELAVRRAQAAADSARARLRLAEAQLARSRDLAARGFISAEALNQRETEVDVVRADLAIQEAALESAQRNVDKTVLRAPFRAIVAERNGSIGELAQPGTPLLTLIDADGIELVATVQAADVQSLRDATEVKFVALDASYPAKLSRVSPAIDRESRTAEARLAFVGPRAAVGTEGRVEWTDRRAFVPPELLVLREGKLGVFVVERNRARFVPLPGAQEGRPAAADLAASALVVSSGHRALHPGQAVDAAVAAVPAR